eukprot:515786-Hanusia_phi.AAC.1
MRRRNEKKKKDRGEETKEFRLSHKRKEARSDGQLVVGEEKSQDDISAQRNEMRRQLSSAM